LQHAVQQTNKRHRHSILIRARISLAGHRLLSTVQRQKRNLMDLPPARSATPMIFQAASRRYPAIPAMVEALRTQPHG
jgi:hypothetical protein